MTKEEIFGKIQEIVAEELDKEAGEILLTTNLQEDLEADSLDLFQVINEIEDAFDVKIETEINQIKTGETPFPVFSLLIARKNHLIELRS